MNRGDPGPQKLEWWNPHVSLRSTLNNNTLHKPYTRDSKYLKHNALPFTHPVSSNITIAAHWQLLGKDRPYEDFGRPGFPRGVACSSAFRISTPRPYIL